MKKSFFELLEEPLNNKELKAGFSYRLNDKWCRLSYQEFWQLVVSIALGLKKLGIEEDQRVGIISASSPYWLIMDLAIMSIGACSVPLFEDVSEENLAFEVENAEIAYLFIDGQEQWDELGNKKKYFDNFIIKDITTDDNGCIDFFKLAETGEKFVEEEKNLYKEIRQKVKTNKLATIIYTSGSSGVPKGVELSQDNLAHQILGIRDFFPLTSSDKILSCLPLAHIFERTVVYYYLSCGVSISFVEIKKVGEFIGQVQPTLMTGVPRLLEKIYLKTNARVEHSSGLKKILGKLALNRAISKEVSGKKNLGDRIFTKLVYDKIYQLLGGSLRMIVSGGAPLSKNVERFFNNIGIPIYQGYGLTECSPVVASNCPKFCKFSTVGKIFPQVKVKIAKDGEVLIQSPSLMLGYHKAQEQTDEVIKEGWFHSGDLGVIDSNGYLEITGRKKELFKTSSGKYVSPIYLESMLMQIGLIDYALVIADNRHFVSCLLFVDAESYKQLATLKNSNEPFKHFYEKTETIQKFDKFIENLNERLNHWEQIRKYKIILDPLSISNGELSTKMALRRHVIEEKYKDILKVFYAN